ETPHLTSRQRTVELFLSDVEHNSTISRESWSIDSLAEHCNRGVTACSKCCRDLVNAGPMEFLNRCRLDHAARQLREQPGISVTDVAFANGFNSSQYFATCFRRRFKISPSRFASKSGNSETKK